VGDCLSHQLKEVLESRSARLIEFEDPLIEVLAATGPTWGPVVSLASLRTNVS
jgi:hypothetical protein